MSMDTYHLDSGSLIYGIGLSVDCFTSFVKKPRFLELLKAPELANSTWVHPDDLAERASEDSFEKILDDCGVHEVIGEILCLVCDESKLLKANTTAADEVFFYYQPPKPWECRENEPKSEEDACNLIVAAIRKLCDMPEAEIRKNIDTDLVVVDI